MYLQDFKFAKSVYNHTYFVFLYVTAALLYSAFGVAIEKARGAEDDINTVAAGTLTGMLFKSGGWCLFLFYASILYLALMYINVPLCVFNLLNISFYQ